MPPLRQRTSCATDRYVCTQEKMSDLTTHQSTATTTTSTTVHGTGLVSANGRDGGGVKCSSTSTQQPKVLFGQTSLLHSRLSLDFRCEGGRRGDDGHGHVQGADTSSRETHTTGTQVDLLDVNVGESRGVCVHFNSSIVPVSASASASTSVSGPCFVSQDVPSGFSQWAAGASLFPFWRRGSASGFADVSVDGDEGTGTAASASSVANQIPLVSPASTAVRVYCN